VSGMSDRWPSLNYSEWSATCDTLHGHTQVLGKLAAVLAPPEPELQHAALRLSARGWETLPLPAPDDSGAFVVGLDLRAHEAFVEHSGGCAQRVALIPERAVGEVTREVLAAVHSVLAAFRGTLPRSLDAGQRLVGLLRSRGEPLLGVVRRSAIG
jgi:Family of unknown function (DUF5996)